MGQKERRQRRRLSWLHILFESYRASRHARYEQSRKGRAPGKRPGPLGATISSPDGGTLGLATAARVQAQGPGTELR